MACCTESDCPMHQGESRHSGPEPATTQAQADTCCAASEPQQSDHSAPSFFTVNSGAALGAGAVLPVPVPALVASDAWRTVAPVPIAPVPRHLLLSVFLV